MDPAHPSGVVLACDLGGTSFRAALVAPSGRILAQSSASAPVSPAASAEVDADAWWRALLATAEALAQMAPVAFADVRGVAICGITRTQVLVDGEGRPVRPALLWTDTRAGAIAAELAAALPDHPERGQINAFHPLARLAWLSRHEPAVLARTCAVLDPKDYLNLRLTGRAVSDPVASARLAAAVRPEGGLDLLSAAGLRRDLAPLLCEPWEAVGPVRPGLPAPLDRLAGATVLTCSNDTFAAVVGLGGMRAGQAYNISGTTEVLGVVDPDPLRAEGLMSVDWRGLFQLGGPSQNGADTMAWLLNLVGGARPEGVSVSGRVEALLSGPRDAAPVLFLPYLQGERVPHWDPGLRGALLGLNRRHGPTDLAWAVMEGVAFQNRLVLRRAEAARGGPVESIRLGGGAAANPWWCQVKADVCGRPVVVGEAAEPGLLGAALIAWTGLGAYPDLAQAQQAACTVAKVFAPDPARVAAYDRLAALFAEAEARVAPLSHALGDVTLPTPRDPG